MHGFGGEALRRALGPVLEPGAEGASAGFSDLVGEAGALSGGMVAAAFGGVREDGVADARLRGLPDGGCTVEGADALLVGAIHDARVHRVGLLREQESFAGRHLLFGGGDEIRSLHRQSPSFPRDTHLRCAVSSLASLGLVLHRS